jgi:hypothetical protein
MPDSSRCRLIGGKKTSLCRSEGPEPGCMSTLTSRGSAGAQNEPARLRSALCTVSSRMWGGPDTPSILTAHCVRVQQLLVAAPRRNSLLGTLMAMGSN